MSPQLDQVFKNEGVLAVGLPNIRLAFVMVEANDTAQVLADNLLIQITAEDA